MLIVILYCLTGNVATCKPYKTTQNQLHRCSSLWLQAKMIESRTQHTQYWEGARHWRWRWRGMFSIFHNVELDISPKYGCDTTQQNIWRWCNRQAYFAIEITMLGVLGSFLQNQIQLLSLFCWCSMMCSQTIICSLAMATRSYGLDPSLLSFRLVPEESSTEEAYRNIRLCTWHCHMH